MTAFITLCLKSARFSQALRCCLGGLLWLGIGMAHAQSAAEISQFRVERVDDEVQLSAQVQFDLSAAVEDALLKGIPMYFTAETDILRERWYWYDKRVSSVARQMRLAYQPLTRHWRLNVAGGGNTANGQGLVLNQSFDTLQQALGVIKRVSSWKIADAAELDPGTRYKVEFRFRLDLSQLPRPFQIGAIGQAEWDISAVLNTPLLVDLGK